MGNPGYLPLLVSWFVRLGLLMPKGDEVRVDIIAEACHNANRAICEAFGDFSQVSWEEASEEVRKSACAGVRTCLAFPSITPAQLHEEWCNGKQADGWTFGPIKDAEKKTHPCLVPYNQLPDTQKVKDYVFRATVRGCLNIFDRVHF